MNEKMKWSRREVLRIGSTSVLAGLAGVGAAEIGRRLANEDTKEARRHANIHLFKQTGEIYSVGLNYDIEYTLLAHNEKQNSALVESPSGDLIITNIQDLVQLEDGKKFIIKKSSESNSDQLEIEIVN